MMTDAEKELERQRERQQEGQESGIKDPAPVGQEQGTQARDRQEQDRQEQDRQKQDIQEQDRREQDRREQATQEIKLYMDLHTHTVASGHGYSTLQENIAAAKEAGLTFLGMSEHAPAMPGGPHKFFFGNYRCIPRQFGDLRLFCGVEANIMDYNGSLDLEERLLAKQDYVIASMHTSCVKPGTEAQNTQASILAMRNPYVKILGHPDDSRYPINREELVIAAGEEKVAIEINNSSLHPQAARKGGRENILELLTLCARYRVPVILGTDSHISYTIGHFEASLELIRETNFPSELILNTDPANIVKVVNCTV